MSLRRIYILGHTGFIGGYLFKSLGASLKNFELVGLSSKGCNLLSLDSTQKALSGIRKEDIVIFAAAIPRAKDNSYDAMTKNILMIENFLKVVSASAPRQIIYLSSVDVYGCEYKESVRLPLNEHSPLQPDDYYGIGKVACEFLFQKAARENNFPLAVLRFPGVYGAGDKGQSLISLFVQKAMNEKKLTVFSDGAQLRTYIYVDDIANVVLEIIKKPFDATLNVASHKSYSVLQIAEMIKGVVNDDCQIEFRPKLETATRTLDLVFDNKELIRTFPKLKIHDIKEGIEAYLANSLEGWSRLRPDYQERKATSS